MSLAASSWLVRYGSAVLATLIAVCLNQSAVAADIHVTFLASYGAVALSAWYGGLGPAMLATGASVVSMGFSLAFSSADTASVDTATVLGLALFGVTAGLIGLVVARVRRLQGELQARIQERTCALDKLHEAEYKYRTLVEQLPAVMYITALDYGKNYRNRFIYVSPQVKSMTGFSPAECIADPELWVRQLHPDDRLRVLDEARESSATGKPFCSEHRLLTRDGQVRWVSVQGIVIPDAAGRPLFRRGVMLDITGQKRTQEELESANWHALGNVAAATW
jgi:PAS domain S-box-containing protein